VILKTKSEKIIFFLRFSIAIIQKETHISTHGLSEVAKNIEEYLNHFYFHFIFQPNLVKSSCE
jgi:hypothetical protein